MSWHYSQALVAAYSEENSLDGNACAPSNGTPTHGMFWSPDKTTDVSNRSRSGMTFRPSTGSHGADLLTWYLAASRAKTSAQPERAQESKASAAVCGSTWRESSVKYCHASSSWKTHQCLWEEVLPSSSLTLPKWGMMRNGVLWERITSPLPTSGTGYGSSENFPTPYGLSGNQGQGDGEFGKAIRQWPTPNQRDWEDTGATQGNRKSPNLGTMVHQRAWPTPRANESTESRETQAARQARGTKASKNLTAEVGGGQLNPTWVEWLMGWPLGWTDCAASATDKFRQWQNSHGIF